MTRCESAKWSTNNRGEFCLTWHGRICRSLRRDDVVLLSQHAICKSYPSSGNLITASPPLLDNSAVQSQKAVTTFLSGKQILPFGFALQNIAVAKTCTITIKLLLLPLEQIGGGG